MYKDQLQDMLFENFINRKFGVKKLNELIEKSETIQEVNAKYLVGKLNINKQIKNLKLTRDFMERHTKDIPGADKTLKHIALKIKALQATKFGAPVVAAGGAAVAMKKLLKKKESKK
jgi:hypothetical protein